MAPKEILLEKEFSHSVREIERLKNVAKGMKRKQRISNMGNLLPTALLPECKNSSTGTHYNNV